ncbi:MAG: hypothetical protein AAGI34_15135 [Pseudomonadota bacterium]
MQVISHTTLTGADGPVAPGTPVTLEQAEAESLIKRGLAKAYTPPPAPVVQGAEPEPAKQPQTPASKPPETGGAKK